MATSQHDWDHVGSKVHSGGHNSSPRDVKKRVRNSSSWL